MQQDKKLQYTQFIRTSYKESLKNDGLSLCDKQVNLEDFMFSIGDVVLCDGNNLNVDDEYLDIKNKVYAFVLDVVLVKDESSDKTFYGIMCYLFSFEKDKMYPIKRNKTIVEGILHEKLFMVDVDSAICTVCSIHVPHEERPDPFTSNYISSNYDDVLPLDFKTGILIYSYAKTEIDGQMKIFDAVGKIEYAYWCDIYFNGRQFDINTDFWTNVKKLAFDPYLDPSKLSDRRCRKTRNTKYLCDSEWKFLMQYLQNTWPRPIGRKEAAEISSKPELNSKILPDSMYIISVKIYSILQLLRENYSASLLHNILHDALLEKDSRCSKSNERMTQDKPMKEADDCKSPVDNMEDADEDGDLKGFIVKDDSSEVELSEEEETNDTSESSISDSSDEKRDENESDDSDVSSTSGNSDEYVVIDDDGVVHYDSESEDEIVDGLEDNEETLEDDSKVKYKKRKTENLLEDESIPELPLINQGLLGSPSKTITEQLIPPEGDEFESLDLDLLEW